MSVLSDVVGAKPNDLCGTGVKHPVTARIKRQQSSPSYSPRQSNNTSVADELHAERGGSKP